MLNVMSDRGDSDEVTDQGTFISQSNESESNFVSDFQGGRGAEIVPESPTNSSIFDSLKTTNHIITDKVKLGEFCKSTKKASSPPAGRRSIHELFVSDQNQEIIPATPTD